MCMNCQMPAVAETGRETFGDRMLGVLNSAALAHMIAVGHRTGLFDTMNELPPSTSARIAEAAGLNERYVREWLGAMTLGRIVEFRAEEGVYSLPAANAAFLTRGSAPNNLAAFTQYFAVLGNVEDRIVECFEKGGGVPYSEFPRFQAVMAEDSGQSVLPALFDHILPLVPGLTERLERGIDVLEVGFGRGKALNLMARRFPNSRFTGFEISEEGILFAETEAATHGTRNITFRRQDAAAFRDTAAFDLALSFDAVHDQARPDLMLANIRRALRPGGAYLMQDIDTQSNLEANMDHPMGPLIFTISCMHCMTVSLAAGGMGLGAAWGEQTARRMLREAGFGRVAVNRLPHDVQNAYYVAAP